MTQLAAAKCIYYGSFNTNIKIIGCSTTTEYRGQHRERLESGARAFAITLITNNFLKLAEGNQSILEFNSILFIYNMIILQCY